MPLRDLLEFLALAAIWGASFLFMRIAAPELGPVPLMLLRCVIGALTLLPVLWLRKAWPALRASAGHIALVGVVNSAIPFVLLGAASLVLAAGTTSILNALAPLWAAAIAFAVFGDRLSRWQLIGLVLGVCGVILLSGSGAASGESVSDATLMLAFAAAVAATFAYGVGANLTRARLRGVNPLAVAFGSQVSASAVLLVPALLLWPEPDSLGQGVLPSTLWVSVLALGTVCTGLAYLLFFRLIGSLGATRAVSVTFVIPVFGLGWGAWLLNETIDAWTLAGAAVIVLGTALATGTLKPRRPSV